MNVTRKPRAKIQDSQDIRLGRLTDALGFNLRLAQEAAFQAFSHRVGDSDLKPRRYAMLTIIHENPGLTQAALGRASGRGKSTITPALQDLIRRGLVRRGLSPSDRRVQKLWLTRKGEKSLGELTRHAQAHNDMLTAIIGSGNRELFLQILARIIAECGNTRSRPKAAAGKR